MQMLCECLEKALNQEIERCRIDAQRQSDETENEKEREFMSVQIQDGLVLPVGLPPEYKMNDTPPCPNIGPWIVRAPVRHQSLMSGTCPYGQRISPQRQSPTFNLPNPTFFLSRSYL